MEMPNPNIPNADPEDWDEEEIEEMGIQQAFFVLGQIRCHEVIRSINMDQLLAAMGIAPKRQNLESIIHEVRGKTIRVERQTREETAFKELILSAGIDDLGPAVFGYTNGFHAALGQLAKMVSTMHVVDSGG